MISNSKNNKKIAINTFALYIKMIYSIAVSLFSTRLIVSALGIEDYGIYMLISGIVSLLTFLNVSMSIATQRFMSIAMGEKKNRKLKSIFQISTSLHLWIGILVVVFLEIGGVFFFNSFLNISEDRINSAIIVYQLMIISTFFTINAVPYDAAISSNEEMWVDSIIGFIETTLKLLVAFYLLYTQYDKLIVYSILIAVILISSRLMKSIYCKKKYDECKGSSYSLSLDFNNVLMKEMIGFAGWNTLGALFFVGRNQLIAVILNVFHGTLINAAYGVASQINAQISGFSRTLLKAINPQIVKSEGEKDRPRMLLMANFSAKFSFFIFSFLLIPLFVEMNYVLRLWLKEVPISSLIFCRLILLSTLVIQLSNGIMLSMQSIGKLKIYTIVVNLVYALNIPISIALLYSNFEPYYVFISSIFIEFGALLSRSIIANKYIEEFKLFFFIREIILKQIIVFVLVLFLAFIVSIQISESFLRLVFIILLSSSLLILLFYYFILNINERKGINNLLDKIFKKIFR